MSQTVQLLSVLASINLIHKAYLKAYNRSKLFAYTNERLWYIFDIFIKYLENFLEHDEMTSQEVSDSMYTLRSSG